MTEYLEEKELFAQLPLGAQKVGTDWLNTVPNARPWIYGTMVMKGTVGILGDPGGTGKSAFALSIALSVATGRDLLGEHDGPLRQRNVLVISNEDDENECRLRIQALCQAHSIKGADLEGRFYLVPGYSIRVAETAGLFTNNTVNQTAAVSELSSLIREQEIELITFDPFVSLHGCDENNNGSMEKVMDVIRGIARAQGCGVLCLHHTGKAGDLSDPDNALGGATAVKDAARAVAVLARMTRKEAEELLIEDTERIRYIRMVDGKKNYSLPGAKARWFCMSSVKIDTLDEDGKPYEEWVGAPIKSDLDEDERKEMGAVAVMEAIFPILLKTGKSEIPTSSVSKDIKAALRLEDDASKYRRTMNRLPKEKPGPKIKHGGDWVKIWVVKGQPSCYHWRYC